MLEWLRVALLKGPRPQISQVLDINDMINIDLGKTNEQARHLLLISNILTNKLNFSKHMSFDLVLLIINFLAFFLALTVHEFCHAASAYYLGDKTAAYAGRLTLNPLAHIDLLGTIILPLVLILTNAGFVFGWAKPVPVNYYNLKNQHWGPAIVSLAGPLANLVFGIFCIILLKIATSYFGLGENNLLINFLYLLAIVNFILMIFNLIPIPPLDGSKVLFALLPPRWINVQYFLERWGIFILIILLVFGSDFLYLIFSGLIRIVNRLL